MKMFNFKNMDSRKLFGTVIGGILFICCILFFTYAYYAWESDPTNVVIGIQDLSTECITGPDVNVINIGPVLDYKDGVKTTFSLGGSAEAEIVSLSLDITHIDEELKVDYFKYALVYDTDGGTDYDYANPIKDGNFSEMVVGSNTIVSSLPIPTSGIYSYQFIVYIDGSVYNDSNIQNKSLESSLLLGNCSSGQVNSGSVNVNEPNLDSGNLIPVYYDNDDEVWKKADRTNGDGSWYDYGNKKWANAVIIGDSTKKATYKSADIDTPIADADITAFYVWIPRFKYRVWNITRQGGAESTYAYTAYSTGIEIDFEEGTNSTGNVECTYDVTTIASATNLSDTCIYNGTDTITTESVNTNYTDAWYTHPAFTFGGRELEGFWIGKFETSGEANSPTILADVSSLREQDISTQFTTSKVFQNYLSNNIDAHMLTNLEWGAVAYLTHSIYGLCNGTSCQGVYINNSSDYYTGRSGGNIAGKVSTETTFYNNSELTTDSYNANGYYNYEGYMLDSSGAVTTTKDITKVASTTGNVTGVYDMSGGGNDIVMGNMVDSNHVFYPNSSVTSWDGSSILDSKYYDSYSYGADSYNALAFNRARLGDATSETLGSSTSANGTWKIGNGIIGSNSYFAHTNYHWFTRGGSFSNSTSGLFDFTRSGGTAYIRRTFRSSLS